MNQYVNKNEPQVLYQGKWVSKDHFRVFVYNQSGQKLANTYKEYCDLIESGLWFSSKNDINPTDPVNIKSGKKARNASTIRNS